MKPMRAGDEKQGIKFAQLALAIVYELVNYLFRVTF